MSDIVGFLLARVAEDEAVARAPHESVRAVRVQDMERVEWDDSCGYARLGLGRVLAECEAKRRIVEMHAPQYAVAYREPERLLAEAFDQDKVRALASSGPIWPYPASEQTLLALAQPYADHADFDPAWRLDIGS